MNHPKRPRPKAITTIASPRTDGLQRAAARAEQKTEATKWPIKPPDIFPGVVPKGQKAQVAMDAGAYEFAGAGAYAYGDVSGFPGYAYLSQLALRAEYRNMASGLATELTREWITLNSSETAGESTKKKITEITQELERLRVQQVIRLGAEQDAFFGSGQILIDLKDHDVKTPLILDPRTIKKESLIGFRNVEPIWTTPLMYNALDPSRKDFYRPSSWWVMGKHWHASRLMIIITRAVPDILKPAFNFSGISLSQLAEPYVNNWLRARQSVSDLINNFSIIVLKTAMDQVLAGGDDGTNLFARIKLFTATRSNKGVMALDKDREELEQLTVSLSGLSELQAQAQEQCASVCRMPVEIYTGVQPSGLNASGNSGIRIWNDWCRAQQQAYYRQPIDTMIKVIQLSKYGEIDPDITFQFNPLYQLTEEELSVVRVNESIEAGNYIDRGVIDAQEKREMLARDPESGYQGIQVDREIAPPNEAEMESSLGRGTA